MDVPAGTSVCKRKKGLGEPQRKGTLLRNDNMGLERNLVERLPCIQVKPPSKEISSGKMKGAFSRT
ncbi:MAG: hypothetical protein HYW25_05865 [Candidatus Aenigmarchaeota archaeon]|nr:hypothetical protein [Candidatus Aenigmarchaeota archaeon]